MQSHDSRDKALNIAQKITICRSYIKARPRIYDLDIPSYEAIPYQCRDSEEKSRIIVVDGRSLKVTNTAYEILLDRSLIGRARVPWIDSVSVDEDIDHFEKRGQALLARDVYTRASQVVIWLEHCEYSELAIAQLENLLSYHRKYIGTLANLSSPIGDPESISGRALRGFLNHPWF